MDAKYYEGGLEELRRRINAGEVSALIGAGFSKNVSNEFPLWDDLLYDMVCELFKPEIETGFQNQILYKIKTDHKEYCKNKVREIIQREGYLNIVSQYIKNKGYRETVEDYIEKHTPYAFSKRGENHIKIREENIDCAPLQDSNFEAHKRLLEIGWQNIYTTNYDNLLEFTKDEFGKQWDLVRSAHDLAFSKQKNAIIKLHGDLCTKPESDSFEFDGIYNHRYIISKEDYENYPKEHEAFTQLMRISLLRGTFCLIGFSGADPNFIGWIHWVRDILVKNNHNESKKKGTAGRKKRYEDFKIFLFDMKSDEPSSDKKQFYKNHRIFYIPLLNPDVMQTIKDSSSKNSAEDGTNKGPELMGLLLAYLNNKQSPGAYENLWKDLMRTDKVVGNSIIQQLEQIKPSNRICQNVRYQKYFLVNIFLEETFTKAEISLVLLALEDTYYLPDYYPGLIEKLETQIESKKQKKRLAILEERTTTLKDPFVKMTTTDSDAKTYEQVLRNAFSLNFTALKETLERWDPKGTFIPKKALFISLFQKEKAQDLLLDYIDSECEIQERYYATELLNLIIVRDPDRYSTAKYKNKNMVGLLDLNDVILRKATEQDHEPKPYGDTRITLHFGQENEGYENSLRVLQFLIEGPFCLRFNGWMETISMKDWYPVFKNLFEEYPFPILFYSLQGTSEDVLRRVGQEYAYSDVLSETKTNVKLLDCMLDALLCEDTPEFYRDNLYRISQELFVSVEPSCWEQKFSNIWDRFVLPEYAKMKDSKNSCKFKFICSGLKFIRSKAYKTKFILDCLQNEKKNKQNTIDFLDNLQVSEKEIEITPELRLAIDTFCQQLDNVLEYRIAGNIYSILSSTNITDIAVKMKKLVHGDSLSMEVLIAISKFSKISGKQKQFVKQVIIGNKKLWDNGIGEELPSDRKFIKLSSLKGMVDFAENDIKTIYQKLKGSFNQVISDKDSLKNDSSCYLYLFKEMLWFIRDNEKVLSQETDLPSVESELKERIKKSISDLLVKDALFSDNPSIIKSGSPQLEEKFKECIGDADLEKALLSDDASKVASGLDQLKNEINRKGIDEFPKEINLLIDRVLFKRKEELQRCLNYLVYFLSNFYNNEDLPKDLAEKLRSVVQLYTKETLQNLELNVPAAAEKLVQISEFLVKHRYKPFPYWSDLKESGRFNNL